MMRSWIIVAGLILLAACSPTVGPTDLPFYTATPHVLEPLPYPNLTDSPAAFPELSGGNPQLVPSSSSVQFTISGDIEAAVTGGTIVYNFVPAAGALSARDKIFISASDASASQQIAFEFSPGMQPGTYPLGSAPQWIPGLLNAHYLRLSDDGSGEARIQSYNQNVSGTLTLTETGAAISGVFEFSAQWIT
ncbi:MAG: hypothetical protein L0Z53_18725, partial [Acidobacteriales bacterium]|nr:hypothetical protein [Terriglobales bacterium]